MRIGVIGAFGFVGVNLINYIKANNPDMAVFGASRRNGIDAKNTDSLARFINDNDINCIVNLAAYCGGIGLNKKAPFDLWYESTMIGASVLNACLQTHILKLINVGTVCSYSSDTPVPFKESDLMRFGDPESTNKAYGIAKLNSLHGGVAASSQYGLNVVNLIPVNMYGEHDNFDLGTSHVIPAIIKKIHTAKMTGTTPVFWGDGSATREFLYVNDFSSAIVSSIMKLNNDSEFYNIGSGTEISIADLVKMISVKMGYDGKIEFDPSMPNGQMRRCLDVSKLYNKIGWKAQTSLSDGLDNTIIWYYKITKGTP